jgi:UDP-N-acetylglucosamine pyrophosphorylase
MTGSLPEIGRENWRQSASALVDPGQWTAVIPAAGRGSRLGFHRPKILYPVAGRPILDWLLDFLVPTVRRLYLCFLLRA